MGFGLLRLSKNELVCDSRTNRPLTFAEKSAAWQALGHYDRKGSDLIVVDIAEWQKLCRDSILIPI